MTTIQFQSERYAGKPFLRFVDAWVLKCIDELDPGQEAKLRELQPKLRAAYEREGAWNEIVRLELDYSLEVEEEIRKLWRKNSQLAERAGHRLEPLQFVEMFVDNNIMGSDQAGEGTS